MRKGFKTLLLTALLTLGTTLTAFAGTWQSDGGTFKYLKDDGTYAVNEWQSNQGIWYHLDANGIIQTGWIQDNGIWYYLEPSGAMRTDALTENGKVYYFNTDGACQNPNGETIGNATSQVSEESYINSVVTLVYDMEAVATQATQQFETLDSDDVEGAKQLIHNMKAPFYNFLSVTAPDRFKDADTRLKNGCSTMIQTLDGLIALIDGITNGTLNEDSAMARLEYLTLSMSNSLSEFEAGANILDSLIQ